MKNPETEAEWQECLLFAYALRALHDCRLYGLIEGGPKVDVERCDYFIEQGRIRGMVAPSDEEIRRYVVEIVLLFN